MKNGLLALALLLASIAGAQEVNIIPKPTKMEVKSGRFTINKETRIVVTDENLESSARFLNDYLQKFYGFQLTTAKQPVDKNSIVLNYTRIVHTMPGAYKLVVNNKGVQVSGDNATGTFYGIQSLIQLDRKSTV